MSADEAEAAFDKQGWLADKPAFMQRRYEELFKQQDAVDEHLANLQKERHELEKKYLALTAPLLEERNRIVRGEVVPEGGEGDVKGIPEFWARVFASHEAFEDILSTQDMEILKLLTDVRVERSQEMRDNKQRYVVKLIFTFGENDFMKETELTKTYVFADAEESIAAGAEGCKITWQDGKDPTKKHLKKKDGKGGWIRKVKDQPSVFSFFTPPQMPDDSDLSDDDQDALEEAIEMDFAMGSAIADDIIPAAFKYYTGQMALEDEDYDPGDEDDDDESDGDGDSDEDEDDDDDPAPPPEGKEGECKQQ